MTHDELVEKVVTALLDAERKSMGLPPIEHHIPANRLMIRPEAEAAISTILTALQEPTEGILDAYWIQSGESKEMRSRVHCRADNYWRAMLAASPLVESRND